MVRLFPALFQPSQFYLQLLSYIPSDYSTIQEGINASVDGDTVLVAQGNYIENLF